MRTRFGIYTLKDLPLRHDGDYSCREARVGFYHQVSDIWQVLHGRSHDSIGALYGSPPLSCHDELRIGRCSNTPNAPKVFTFSY
jgi:hypothetical protein